MVNAFQNASSSTRLGIPMIYGIDVVHGHNNVYKATIFPHNIGLGATRDPVLIKKIGAATALEVRATGIHYTFAPCIAVRRDPRWGRSYESYSEDPKILKLMTEIIPGLQGDIPAGSRKGVPYVGQKPVSGYKLKEITGSCIFAGGGENDVEESDAANPTATSKTGLRMYQLVMHLLNSSTSFYQLQIEIFIFLKELV